MLGMPPVLSSETGRQVLGRWEACAEPCLAITGGHATMHMPGREVESCFWRG